MNSVLLVRDACRSLYSRFGMIITPILRMLLAFLMLTVIQNHIGYYSTLSRPLVICAASVLCAFFPGGFLTFVCALFVIADMFAVSVMMAGFTAVLAVFVFLLYFGYRPGTGIIISIVPLMFLFRLPFIVPVLLGLTVGFPAAVPAAIGVISWNVLRFFSGNAAALAEGGTSELSEEIVTIARTILTNEYMYVVIFAFVLCIAAVYIISRLSLNYARIISVSVGTVILAVFMVIGGAYFEETSLLTDILGLVATFAVAIVYVMVFYSVDFNKTEHLSFEDDDYYYYVKAVPKIKPVGTADEVVDYVDDYAYQRERSGRRR